MTKQIQTQPKSFQTSKIRLCCAIPSYYFNFGVMAYDINRSDDRSMVFLNNVIKEVLHSLEIFQLHKLCYIEMRHNWLGKFLSVQISFFRGLVKYVFHIISIKTNIKISTNVIDRSHVSKIKGKILIYNFYLPNCFRY